MFSFHDDVLVVRAVKDIVAGDEIFNCYGQLLFCLVIVLIVLTE